MTGYVLILVALQLAVPVRCYQTETAWQERGADLGFTQPAWTKRYAAYYLGDTEVEPAHIALGPQACWHVRHATEWGAFVMGHEFAHRWQDVTGRPSDEREADRIGVARQGWWQRRLAAFFRVPPMVRLAGR